MHLIAVVDKMIKGAHLDGEVKATDDIPIFKQLIYGGKVIPLYAQQLWKNFTSRQKIVKINMVMMYRCYKPFVPALFSTHPKRKHLLLLHKIVSIFPNVTKIICHHVDCLGWHIQAAKDKTHEPWRCLYDKYSMIVLTKHSA